jgi:hypothetical protein
MLEGVKLSSTYKLGIHTLILKRSLSILRKSAANVAKQTADKQIEERIICSNKSLTGLIP